MSVFKISPVLLGVPKPNVRVASCVCLILWFLFSIYCLYCFFLNKKIFYKFSVIFPMFLFIDVHYFVINLD